MPAQIKKLRTDLKLSQTRFGKKIGISGKTVSAYEQGRALPSFKVFEKIAKAYGVDINPVRVLSEEKVDTLILQMREVMDKLAKNLQYKSSDGDKLSL